MQIQPTIIDDFKTERKDILPPLPPVLRLIPILFFLSILLVVVLVSVFTIQLTVAKDRLQTYEQGLAEATARLAQIKSDRSRLEEQVLRANDVEKWVSNSQQLQPLVVAIARSINEGSSLVDLRLQRAENSSGQLNLSLRIATGNVNQLDETLGAIGNAGYRIFSPQQTLSGGEIDYSSTLVWQDPSGITPVSDTPPPTQ